MLTVISNKLAIDLDRVWVVFKFDDAWRVVFGPGDSMPIDDFERIRIWEILGTKVGSAERYKCCE